MVQLREAPVPMRADTHFRNRHLLALVVLVAAFCLVQVLWIRHDTVPMPHTDAYEYLTLTLRFVDQLGGEQPIGLWAAIEELNLGGRPPLYQLLTVPWILLFGRSTDAALSINVLFQTLLMVSVFGIGRLCLNGRAGLLAVFLVACYPPILHLSKIYRPHFALPACTALNLWLLLILLRTRSPKAAWGYFGSLAFGLLIHTSFLWTALVPAFVFGTYVCLFQTAPRAPSGLRQTPAWLAGKLGDPLVLRGVLPSALLACVPTLFWFLTAGEELLTVYRMLQESGETLSYAKQGGFHEVPPHYWWYVLTAPGAISSPFAALALAGVLFGVFQRRLPTLVMVVAFLGAYHFINQQPAKTWWYFASALPIAAVLSAVLLCRIRPPWLRRALVFVALASAGVNFCFATWGLKSLEPIAASLGAPDGRKTCQRRNTVFCPSPPRGENWRIQDILRTIVEDAESISGPCELLVVKHGDAFYASCFRYYLTRDWPEASLTIEHQGFQYLLRPYQMRALLTGKYLLYVTPAIAREGYVAKTTKFLTSPPDEFAATHDTMARFELPNGATAVLIRRTAPLTLKEAKASIKALGLLESEAHNGRTVLRDLRAPSWAKVGDALMSESKLVEAAGAYRRAVSLAPVEERPAILSALELLQDGQLEEAVSELQAAASAGSPNGIAQRILSQLEQQIQDPEYGPQGGRAGQGHEVALLCHQLGSAADSTEARSAIPCDSNHSSVRRSPLWMSNCGWKSSSRRALETSA